MSRDISMAISSYQHAYPTVFRHLIVIGLLLLSGAAAGKTLNGYVVGVADGDTLTILDVNRQQYKIRLAGIDAPEKAQAYGARSKAYLAGLTFNKTVSVEWNSLDRYGRIIGKVLVGGTDANLEQINAGMAWWYRQYAKEQSPDDREVYEHAEIRAKLLRNGLWTDPKPQSPWEWRKALRRK